MANHQKEHEGRGDAFTVITREQFEAKLKPVNSPMIVSHGWNPSSAPGGTINYRALLVNYDVLTYTNLALVVFVGNRNPIVSNEQFLTAFDAASQRTPSRRRMDSPCSRPSAVLFHFR